MNGLIETLNKCGATHIAGALNQSEQNLSTQVIKWVLNETGINLYIAGPNGENLTATDLNKLKDIDLKFSIKFKLKTNSTENILKLIGPFSGLMIVAFCIVLDSYIIYTIFHAPTVTNGIENLNAFVTLVTGYYHAKAGEIISYWFGSSQVADENAQRKE